MLEGQKISSPKSEMKKSGGWVRVRMEDQRERENSGSASQAWEELWVVVASVAVTILLGGALILPLLVDPIDDVLMATLRRYISAFASVPIAKVLILEPFQNFQVPPLVAIAKASPSKSEGGS